jgi:hypothetical protein
MDFYNEAGRQVARLQQNVNVIFWTNISGLLTYAPPFVPPEQQWVSSRLTINNTGWYCS